MALLSSPVGSVREVSIEAGCDIRRALSAAGETVLVYSADGVVTRTGEQLLHRAERVAGALIARGLQGGTIGLHYRNSAAALEAFIAIELIGGTRLPVERSATLAEAYITFDAGKADAILTDQPVEKVALETGQQLVESPLLELTLLHSDDAPLEGARWTAVVDVDPDRALVVYPRAVIGGAVYGIPTSYANWQSIMSINQDLYRSGGYGSPLEGDECYLTVVQLMHATGMVGSFPFLHLGLPQVVMPRFNAKAVIEAIHTFDVTTLFAVPGMLSRIANEVEQGGKEQLSSLRRVLYGGAPVATDELKRLSHVFGPTLCQLYGRYEAGWPLAVLTPADHDRILQDDEEVVGSCGRPIDAIEVELRPGSDDLGGGEVRSRSGMVSAKFADPDGWCSLGDTALMTANGYLHLTGRLDGMINTGSFHVYPKEVQEAIMEIPTVDAVLVTGEPHPTWGQAVTAYVVSDDQTVATGIRELLRDRLAPYKIPLVVHLVDRLPTI